MKEQPPSAAESWKQIKGLFVGPYSIGAILKHTWKHKHWMGRDDSGTLYCTLCNVVFATGEPPAIN